MRLGRHLDALTAIDGVYPTRRDRRPAGIADVIAQGDLESARTMSYAIACDVVILAVASPGARAGVGVASTTGAGVRIAIVDNGFDASHAELALDGAASGWFRPTPDMDDADFVPGLAEMPVRQHGTQCVGMAGAAANGAKGSASPSAPP